MKIVCLGDSLTYGFGVRRSKVWTKLAEDKLKIEIVNEGINGDTSSGMLSRFYNSVYMQRADSVHIMGGVNDLIVGADLGIIKSNIMSMVHQAAAKFIKPIIGIPTKIDVENVRRDWAEFADFNRVSTKLENYHNWLKEFCITFNIEYIDYYNEFDKLKGSEDVYTDGLHLNDCGNEIMAEIFCRAFVILNRR